MSVIALATIFLVANGLIDEQARHASDKSWLVIEVPDGVRARTGRIQGEARTAVDRNTKLLVTARQCGAVNPVLDDNVSHQIFVVSNSSPDDFQVVACLKKYLPGHFNAGIAKNRSAKAWVQADKTPFAALESVPSLSNEQAD